jgi:hypothetical protein
MVSTKQMDHLSHGWESFGYPQMVWEEERNEEQKNGGSLKSGAENEACNQHRTVWLQLRQVLSHEAQIKIDAADRADSPDPKKRKFGEKLAIEEDEVAVIKTGAHCTSPPSRAWHFSAASPPRSLEAGPVTIVVSILAVRWPNKGWSRPLLPDHGELAASAQAQLEAARARRGWRPIRRVLTSQFDKSTHRRIFGRLTSTLTPT